MTDEELVERVAIIVWDVEYPKPGWPNDMLGEEKEYWRGIARAALDAINASGTHVIADLSSSQMGGRISEAITAAVQAERKRCAGIARSAARDYGYSSEYPPHDIVQNACCAIAAAIEQDDQSA